ncbi:hypothetical protein HDU97_001016 [Phlyctochytrium planicorne]|nr:hypothetical protein HDU97_001016 [Phlyctochytrium planicorne]
MVMIRPRGGDFAYTDVEFEIMEVMKSLNVAGVVFGILNSDGTVDKPRTQRLVELAKPLQVTFHRAFDVSRDPYESLEALISLGVTRVLTSGQDSGALEGLEVIEECVKRAKGRIEILPGGGDLPDSISSLVSTTTSMIIYRGHAEEPASDLIEGKVFMGLPGLPEYERPVTDGDTVKKVVELLQELS